GPYYRGLCNSVLWPAFHYFVDRVGYDDASWAAYVAVNESFADTAARVAPPGAHAWIHDYHLMLVPAMLRARRPDLRVGFFLHIPFPHIEMLRILPTFAELLRELVAYDVIGFQTDNDLRAFLSGVEYVWGRDAVGADGRISIGSRSLTAGVFPIGVDVQAIEADSAEAAQSEPVRRMSASLLGRKLMVGVDRLDYSKGLIERFAAYQSFLESYPENLGKITFMQIAPLSRTDVRAYAEIRQALEQVAGRINGRFADADWTPIRYLNRNIPHGALMGYLRAAQVALVTPARDGMNLVAKEFVAAQDPADPGVLILSPLAGAARELTAAIQANPYDTKGLGHAIQVALAMPLAERRERHASMMEVIRRNDVTAWHERFVGALKGAGGR
ncbi:MAG: alpha,alpha-trehalose-phosphate synthase (UDP-forming), partial [Steroidobacteraceae bacterium]